MTPDRLAEIRAAEQAATPGPWRAEHFEIFADCLHCGERGCEDCDNQGGIISDAGWVIGHKMLAHSEGDSLRWEDAQFLALARTAVPELLAEVERLASFRREGLSLFADANAREDRDNKLVADLMEDGDIQRLALKHALSDLDEEQARADRAEADCQSLRELAADQMRVLGGGLQRAEAEVARLRGALVLADADLRAENAALRARIELADRLAEAVEYGFTPIARLDNPDADWYSKLMAKKQALAAYRASAGGADA